MKTKLTLTIAAAALLMSSIPARGHHAFAAEFDANKPLKLTGTVTKMEWINPHSWIHIDVKNPDGTTTKWMVEGGSPNTLFRLGFTREALPEGAVIIVDGFRAKDGANRAVGANLTFSDGKRLFMGGSAGQVVDEKGNKAKAK
jgi:hypothetical protein